MYTRVGKIEQVNPQEGTCTIRWLDKPGMRYNVLLTQGSPKEWNIPERGEIVLVTFDHNERARIIRYINLGHAVKIKEVKSLPKLKEGEKLWEGGRGSYIYMQQNGNILLSTLDQGFFILEAQTGTLKSETVNWKVSTEGGIANFGLVKRFKTDGETREFQEIIDENGDAYTEFRIRMVETADGTLGITGIDDPFIDITLGTYINFDGNVVNKNNEIATPTKQLAVRISLKNGVKIEIDKEGRVSLEAKSWNINKGEVDVDDPDAALGLETASTKGSKGQHVAREHDRVTIPISTSFVDAEHTTLNQKSSSNVSGALTQLAGAIMSPAGSCFLIPTTLQGNVKLEGEITEGAENTYVGD
ncbi:MAG: hypothetical protein M0R03_03520 [Novosphingobium sp.]|nr:hypothetical protein [Novosphingobium sp.]